MDHISKTDNVGGTQLGINHLVIRDKYNAWVQVTKNIGRLYKKATKQKNFYPLLTVVCTDLMIKYYNKVFPERKDMESVPNKEALEKDCDSVYNSLAESLKTELNFEIPSNGEKKFRRVVNEALEFINFVVLVRPQGKFQMFKNVLFDDKWHMNRVRGMDMYPKSLGENQVYLVTSTVTPSYSVGDDVFNKAGVLVSIASKDEIEEDEPSKLRRLARETAEKLKGLVKKVTCEEATPAYAVEFAQKLMGMSRFAFCVIEGNKQVDFTLAKDLKVFSVGNEQFEFTSIESIMTSPIDDNEDLKELEISRLGDREDTLVVPREFVEELQTSLMFFVDNGDDVRSLLFNEEPVDDDDDDVEIDLEVSVEGASEENVQSSEDGKEEEDGTEEEIDLFPPEVVKRQEKERSEVAEDMIKKHLKELEIEHKKRVDEASRAMETQIDALKKENEEKVRKVALELESQIDLLKTANGEKIRVARENDEQRVKEEIAKNKAVIDEFIDAENQRMETVTEELKKEYEVKIDLLKKTDAEKIRVARENDEQRVKEEIAKNKAVIDEFIDAENQRMETVIEELRKEYEVKIGKEVEKVRGECESNMKEEIERFEKEVVKKRKEEKVDVVQNEKEEEEKTSMGVFSFLLEYVVLVVVCFFFCGFVKSIPVFLCIVLFSAFKIFVVKSSHEKGNREKKN